MIIVLSVSETTYIKSVLSRLRDTKDIIVLRYDTYSQVNEQRFPGIVLVDMADWGLEKLPDLTKDFANVVVLIDEGEKVPATALLEESIQSILVKNKQTLDTIADKLRMMDQQYFYLPGWTAKEFTTNLVEEKSKEIKFYSNQLHKHGLVFTQKQTDIAFLLRLGLKNKEIARILLLTEGTVKVHISHIYKKVGMNCRKEVVALLQSLMRSDNAHGTDENNMFNIY